MQQSTARWPAFLLYHTMWAVTRNTAIRCALLESARPQAEMQLVRHLRDSQAHAARNFRERIQYLVAELFNQSTDEAVNYVKQTGFGESNGNPILSDDHPGVVAMLATHEGVQISLLRLDGTF